MKGKSGFDRGLQTCIVCKKAHDSTFKNKICKIFFLKCVEIWK